MVQELQPFLYEDPQFYRLKINWTIGSSAVLLQIHCGGAQSKKRGKWCHCLNTYGLDCM